MYSYFLSLTDAVVTEHFCENSIQGSLQSYPFTCIYLLCTLNFNLYIAQLSVHVTPVSRLWFMFTLSPHSELSLVGFAFVTQVKMSNESVNAFSVLYWCFLRLVVLAESGKKKRKKKKKKWREASESGVEVSDSFSASFVKAETSFKKKKKKETCG